MVTWLVSDMFRRVAYWYIAPLAIGYALTWFFFPARGGAAPVLAMSLAATYMLGPVAMLGWLATPLIPYLPVSRREVWRAAWIMGTLVPVAVMVALKLPSVLAGSVGWSVLTLSSTMDFLYAGAGCALISNTNPDNVKHGGSRALWIILLFVGGIFMPFVMLRALPTEWAAVSPLHAALFATGAALTAWSAFHPPARWPRRWTGQTTSSAAVILPPRPGRLSGLPRLVGHELAWSSAMAVTLLVTFSLIALVATVVSGSFTTIEDFIASQRLFIFNPAELAKLDGDLEVFGQLGWYAFFMAAVAVRFPETLRHLQVLPLGRPRLHALFMGWPVMIWTVNWGLLAVVHVAFSQPIEDLRIPLWLAFIGLSQLAQALGLRLSARWIPLTLPTVPILVPFARLAYGAESWMLLTVWAIAAVTAVALYVSALSRNETYKRTNPVAARMQGTS